MFKAIMPKATTAIVSLLFVACVCSFSHLASAPLAAAGIVSALLPVLLLMVKITGTDWRQSMGRGRRLLRYAVPVLLLPAASWAGGYPTAFLGVVTTLPTPGITLGETQDVAVDSLGNVYIADPYNSRVVEVNDAGVASVLAFPGLSPALSFPTGVAVDGSGNLYVSDPVNLRVVELSAGGVASVVNTGTLSDPVGLALDAAGDLYIADSTSNHIVEVPAGGAGAVLVITGLGTALNTPRGVAVDLSGNLYIADALNNRIVKVTTPVEGTGAGTVLTISDLDPPLSGPYAVALDGLGKLYIADSGNNRIVTVTPAGVSAVLGLGSDTLNTPRGVAVTPFGAVYIADNNNARIVEAQPTTVGFGHLPAGAVSGTTLTLPFTIAQGTTLGSVQALTQGTAGLDFTVVSAGTTCISGTTNTPCNVVVQFLPTAAGLRRGEVVLFNNASTPVPFISVPIYATGDAPLAALSPGTATLVSTTGATLSAPFQIAFDGAGNMYVANYGSAAGNVVRIPAGGGNATVVSTGGFTLAGAIGVALDGAGNLYISDHYNTRIVEVTAGGVVSVLNITGLSPALNITGALAIDAAGNLYISDYGGGRIVKVTPSGAGSVLGTGSFTFAGDSVLGVAVDAAGTVYIPDSIGNRVVKVTAAGAASLVVPAGITPPLSSPQGLAVDAFGNLYIADAGNHRIVEVTTAGVASVLQMPGQSLLTDYGVTVDASGNVFIPDFSANHIVKVNVAGATLTFPNTNVGSASSPQTATVTNIGDLPLVFAANPTYTANFSEDTGDTNLCAMSTSLDAGTVCDVSVEFTPQSTGNLSSSIVVTDNNLNVSNATESVAVSGTGMITPTSVTLAASPNPAATGQSVTLTAAVSPAPTGSPLGTVSFYYGGTLLGSGNVNSSGVATFSTAALPAGADSLTAVYSGNAAFATSTSSAITETITALTSTTTALTGAPNPATAGQSVTLTATVSPAPTGSTLGTVSFYNGATLLSSGNVNSSGVATFSTATLPAGADSLTAVYSGNAGFATSTSSAVTETITALTSTTTTTTLTASPNPSASGATVTFTATISPAPTGMPSGTVSFYNGTTLLGTETVNSSGVATLTFTTLPTGALSITAVYSGNAGSAASTSSALIETVNTTYTVTAPPAPVTVAEGGSVNINITVPPVGGAFDNVVTMSATGLPPGATASFNPPTVTPGSADAQTLLTIQLAPLAAGVFDPHRDFPYRHLLFAGFALTLGWCGAGFGRKVCSRGLKRAVSFGVLACATAMLAGCGGGFLGPPTLQPGSYVVTVTGTSGSTQASTTVTVVVQ